MKKINLYSNIKHNLIDKIISKYKNDNPTKFVRKGIHHLSLRGPFIPHFTPFSNPSDPPLREANNIQPSPVGNYMFKFNYRNTKTMVSFWCLYC